MKIELRPLAEIKPYEKNPRLNDAAVDAVAESIRRFGFRQPIVVDADGVIVCGHTRYRAAQKLGLAEVPVHVATDLTPEQIRAYRIADNKTAELAEWNLELLPIELAKLKDAGIDWSLLGFDQDELAMLLDPGVQQGLTDPDDVPEPPDAAITQPGDLWLLGDHRLLCGDSSKAEDVDLLLSVDPAKTIELPAGSDTKPKLLPIHLVNTDPPYNVKVEPRSNNAIAAGLSSFGEHGLMHHQSFDLHRMQKAQASPTTRWMWRQALRAAGHAQASPQDRPLANGSLRQRLRSDASRVVRQHRKGSRARARVLHLGRIRERRELPAGSEGLRAVLLAGDHLGEGASGPDPQRLHGQS